jgi:hypothetical protein
LPFFNGNGTALDRKILIGTVPLATHPLSLSLHCPRLFDSTVRLPQHAGALIDLLSVRQVDVHNIKVAHCKRSYNSSLHGGEPSLDGAIFEIRTDQITSGGYISLSNFTFMDNEVSLADEAGLALWVRAVELFVHSFEIYHGK